MPKLKLTQRTVDQLTPEKMDVIYWDEYPKGFGLKVTPAGRHSYIYRYRMGGVIRKYTIGPAPTVAQARKIAERLVDEVNTAKKTGGDDPVAVRKAERDAVTSDRIQEVAAQFIKRHVSHNRSADETKRIIEREIVAVWGGRSIHAITKKDINRLLNRIVDRGAPVMANRVFAAMRKMFNWAFSQGIIESSPCAGVAMPTKVVARDRVLSGDELLAILHATQDHSRPFNAIVQLLIYTAQRRTEVAEMQWDELDLVSHKWIIPAARSKNGKAHTVHLSKPAVAIINAISDRNPDKSERSPYLFIAKAKATIDANTKRKYQNYGRGKRQLDTASDVTDWRLHDIRRTVITGMAEIGVPPHIADKILNHQTGAISGVAAVYQRAAFLDERRDALDRWGEYVTGLLNPTDEVADNGCDGATSNIIPLNRAVR